MPWCSPATATLPSSSCRVASNRHRAVKASGATPPYAPEWTAWSSVRTSTTQSASPRSVVVNAGSPTAQFPESAITYASATRRSRSAGQDRGQRRGADLFLALDEHRHADRRTTREGPQRGEMHGEAALVVAGAATVQTIVRAGRPRTAGWSTATRRRSAGRRDGRRDRPSASPAAPGSARSRPGRRRRRRSRPPGSRPRSAGRPPLPRSVAGRPARSGSALIEGMATNASRSARIPGNWSRTA